MHTCAYIADRTLTWVGPSLWSLGPSQGLPWARSQAWSRPGPTRACSPGLEPRLQGPGTEYVSALLATYVHVPS